MIVTCATTGTERSDLSAPLWSPAARAAPAASSAGRARASGPTPPPRSRSRFSRRSRRSPARPSLVYSRRRLSASRLSTCCWGRRESRPPCCFRKKKKLTAGVLAESLCLRSLTEWNDPEVVNWNKNKSGRSFNASSLSSLAKETLRLFILIK